MVDAVGSINRSSQLSGVRGVSASAPISRAGAVGQAAASGAVPNPVADLAARGPVVDEAKIAQLQQAIASGSYKPDPQAIATKMVALDLPKPSK